MGIPGQSIKKSKPTRLAIYVADVVAITGKHPQTARRMLQAVRNALQKQPWEIVSVRDFALVFGMDEEEIKDFLT